MFFVKTWPRALKSQCTEQCAHEKLRRRKIQTSPEFYLKSARNRPEVARSWPEVGPKSTPSQPKVGPKSPQNRPQVGPKSARSRPQFDHKSLPSWPKVGPCRFKVGPKMAPIRLQVGPKSLQSRPDPHSTFTVPGGPCRDPPAGQQPVGCLSDPIL